MRFTKSLLASVIIFCLFSFTHTVRAQKVTHDGYDRLQVEFATGDLKVAEVTLGGDTYNTLTLDGFLPSSEVGQPCLPTYSSLIEAPFCKDYEVVVSNAVYDTLDGTAIGMRHMLVPTQPSRSKSDTTRHTPVIGKAYSTDAFYHAPLASVEPVGIARDRNLARLQFSPVSYNPVSGQLIVCRSATVEVRYLDADRRATIDHFYRYHTPAFGSGTPVLNNLYPKAVNTSAPIRYLIVANSMFRGHLDSFVQWKRQKGFMVDVAYTDSAAVGGTTTSIQAFIKSQYTNATVDKPAPTYLLLVGDHEQLPAFTGIADDGHITDLYYTTWTSGDNIPDCYHGRFSAQTVAQLTPQIQKTLMYEQYTFNDPSFLDRAVMVAGVDGGSNGDYGYTHADPAMDYAIINYINGTHGFSQVRYFKNNTSIVPAGATNVTVDGNSSSMSATVRSYYNQGAGFINYSAHGSPTCWGTPELNTSQANSMTNTQKFGLMIGNCCQTNKFETTTCLGEALLRKGSYAGAVGYIGGSDYTYWGEDFYWAVGVRNSIGPSMSMAYNASHLGVYDRMMHTHGESFSNWATTQGAILYQGNMAVESSTSGLKHYYWEIYHLMGDPSLMHYLTQADTMSISVAPAILCGTTSLPLTVVPHAYVALVDTLTNRLIASAFADASGNALLTLPADLAIGTYRLAVSAQQYRVAFADLLVISPEGPYPIVTAVTPATLTAGETIALTLRFENYGNAVANNIVAHLSCDNPLLTLSVDSVSLDSLVNGDTLYLANAVSAHVAPNAPDLTKIPLQINTTWTGQTLVCSNTENLTVVAPELSVRLSNPNLSLLPGSDATLTATLFNSGHAPMPASPFAFLPATSLLSVSLPPDSPFSLAPDSDTTLTINLHADSLIPQHIAVPVHYRYGTFEEVLPVYIGQGYSETFEGGSIHLAGVNNSTTQPWVIIDSQAYQGSYCMRSAADLSDYGVSEFTITVNVTAADSLSFYYRVSSEQNYDKFYFLIDGVTKFDASGETDWARAQYLLAAGTHTLGFRYEKDVSMSRGSDCAWIDNLVLPHQMQTVAFFGDTLCIGNQYVLFGDTIDTQNPVSGTAQGVAGGMLMLVDYVIMPPSFTSDSVVACDHYFWNNTDLTSSGSYQHLFTSSHGCDSTVTLILTLHHSVADTVADTAYGNSYLWNDTEYTVSGEYQQLFTTVYGCDSTVTLQLTLIDTSSSEGINPAACQSIRLYPNPTTGIVQLSEHADEVRVYDVQGCLMVCLTDVQTIDLRHLPQGVYTLRIGTKQGTAALRVIRQ